jgi:hypothetical protein
MEYQAFLNKKIEQHYSNDIINSRLYIYIKYIKSLNFIIIKIGLKIILGNPYSREYETSGYGNMTSRYSTPEGVFSGSAGRIGYTIRHKDGKKISSYRLANGISKLNQLWIKIIIYE